ncbi:MAG: hypothetical protein ABFC31_03225 [Clostridiaceae bacterium]
MKRKLSLLLCLLLAIVAFPSAARADSLPPGPKPLEISITGLEGETYYVGLLGHLPDLDAPATEQALADALKNGSAEGNEAVLQEFAAYRDPDGLVALNAVQDCSDSHFFEIDYFPSTEFKVLLYFPTTGHFVVSDRIYTGKTISSSSQLDAARLGVTAESSGATDFDLEIKIDYGSIILDFVVRLLVTLFVEIVIALLFRLRENRVLRFIVIVNVVTQVLLMIVLLIVRFSDGRSSGLLLYFVLEVAVFIIEGLLYEEFLNRLSTAPIRRWIPWVYSLAANVSSFLLGLFIYLAFL